MLTLAAHKLLNGQPDQPVGGKTGLHSQYQLATPLLAILLRKYHTDGMDIMPAQATYTTLQVKTVNSIKVSGSVLPGLLSPFSTVISTKLSTPRSKTWATSPFLGKTNHDGLHNLFVHHLILAHLVPQVAPHCTGCLLGHYYNLERELGYTTLQVKDVLILPEKVSVKDSSGLSSAGHIQQDTHAVNDILEALTGESVLEANIVHAVAVDLTNHLLLPYVDTKLREAPHQPLVQHQLLCVDVTLAVLRHLDFLTEVRHQQYHQQVVRVLQVKYVPQHVRPDSTLPFLGWYFLQSWSQSETHIGGSMVQAPQLHAGQDVPPPHVLQYHHGQVPHHHHSHLPHAQQGHGIFLKLASLVTDTQLGYQHTSEGPSTGTLHTCVQLPHFASIGVVLKPLHTVPLHEQYALAAHAPLQDREPSSPLDRHQVQHLKITHCYFSSEVNNVEMIPVQIPAPAFFLGYYHVILRYDGTDLWHIFLLPGVFSSPLAALGHAHYPHGLHLAAAVVVHQVLQAKDIQHLCHFSGKFVSNLKQVVAPTISHLFENRGNICVVLPASVLVCGLHVVLQQLHQPVILPVLEVSVRYKQTGTDRIAFV
jgi:hypothetical protein